MGVLPINDPRIMNLTEEQIELEFELMDQAGFFEKSNKEAYKDAEFEAFEAEFDKDESEHTTSEAPKWKVTDATDNVVEIPEEDLDDIDWEDDEIFDFEDDES